ncbi:SDR family oxidoreductase [Facilibium subflavum]|uniref:SDR family oxidoreductase n=1 Tax=Facilibium subflavum TaxID=2219058 RepID=UPI000E658FF6|nr:SDR family oxidoreductase [Facilibium subflavum]
MKKHVLITGANRGIGLGFVKQYLHDGYFVTATYRNKVNSKGLLDVYESNQDNLRLIKMDVTSQHEVTQAALFLENNPIDILINNAGVYPEMHARHGIKDNPVENVIEALNVNAIGSYQCIQAFLPNLLLAKAPKVINMSSQAGSITETKAGFGYSYRMSKAALNMLTRCFAAEYQNIITISLRPGWVKTDMGGDRAVLGIKESVAEMIAFIDGLTSSHSGEFYDLKGQTCPW